MYLILLFTFIQTLSAKDLQLEVRNFHYKLSYTAEKIEYKSAFKELTFVKKECNEHILKQFKARMDDILKDPFTEKNLPESYKIIIDKKTFYAPLKSIRADIFKNIEPLLNKLKAEETLNCET